MNIKAVSFVANSDTGKTTIVEKLIRELKNRGYRVGAFKHDAHRFDIDHPGKDSYRFTTAGADTMIITSPDKMAMVKMHSQSPPVEELLDRYFSDVDIVLIEGFKRLNLPKIEVHRKEKSHELLCRGNAHDPTLIAVASNDTLQLDVPVFHLNDTKGIADFLEKRFLLPAQG
ncbi:MAG TPA: molybdopterin-guanine dinucleotide biosynthesis protein B [Thermodesulfovibrionia bacterium]|nr:molybdopterin-guanine dinucleotide biosynthesis protein B [Thermodesulfovibrionia bacterium]